MCADLLAVGRDVVGNHLPAFFKVRVLRTKKRYATPVELADQLWNQVGSVQI